MRSNQELLTSLRAAPVSWMDTAIVVAFETRFEFVAEDDPDPLNRLKSLQDQGGFAIGLAGIQPDKHADRAFLAQVFQEYAGQAWAHRYMDTLRGIVRQHSKKKRK